MTEGIVDVMKTIKIPARAGIVEPPSTSSPPHECLDADVEA
ncbi:MAG: hypothetical protein R3B09_03800 [Nannocystaceae bacterium]